MTTAAPTFRTLEADESRTLLARHRVGRIAYALHDRVDIEPVHYVYDGDWLFGRTDQTGQDVGDSVAQGAVGAVYRLNLAALVVPTTSGRTARLVSAHRPKVPVLAISPRIETVRRLNLLFGVQAVLSDPVDDIRELLDYCGQLAAQHGVAQSGDKIAITAGLPEQELGTNLFEVHRVP